MFGTTLVPEGGADLQRWGVTKKNEGFATGLSALTCRTGRKKGFEGASMAVVALRSADFGPMLVLCCGAVVRKARHARQIGTWPGAPAVEYLATPHL